MVFDLDGVIYRSGPSGKKPVGESVKAIRELSKRKIPFCFVTNSTGSTEDEKAKMLSKILGLNIESSRVFMATSPMRDLAKRFGKKRVLVLADGEEQTNKLATAFGFQNYVTLREYVNIRPALMPYWKKKKQIESVKSTTTKTPEKISAIFVASEPNADWFSSLQVLLDIVTSNGETIEAFGGSVSDTQVVEIFFGNPDFSYPATHSVPRLTCGAFRTCLESLYNRTTGRTLKSVCLGKPERHVFQSAFGSLVRQSNTPGDFDTVYMVGDNPASDIRGANRMGAPWESVLVLTGKSERNSKENPAMHVKMNVFEAVKMALREHGGDALE